MRAAFSTLQYNALYISVASWKEEQYVHKLQPYSCCLGTMLLEIHTNMPQL